MNPVRKFNEVCQAILEKCDEDSVVTIGILVADGQQSEAKQYIINYMDLFDKRSGNYIDFYIPGYYEKYTGEAMTEKYHPNSYVKWEEIKDEPAFYLRRNKTPYYFDKILFDDFVEEMSQRMGIEYTYNPMLILVEIDKKRNRGLIDYQRKLVIELDEDTNRGLRRTGQLFDKIFKIAMKNIGLNDFSKKIKMYYMKGNIIENIIKALEGEWIEAVASVANDVYRYQVK